MDEQLDIHAQEQMQHMRSVDDHGNLILWRDADEVPTDPVEISERGNALRPYRSCSYCGSIHPIDLLRLSPLISVHLADMKYGYPHKLYIDAHHPLAGQEVIMGGRMEGGKIVDPFIRPITKLGVKLYIRHLFACTEVELLELSGVFLAAGSGFGVEFDGDGLRLTHAN